MQEENITLKWGDVVRIHGVNVSKQKTTKGLIMSKGYLFIKLASLTLTSIIKSTRILKKSIFIANPYSKFYQNRILTCMTSC